MSFPVPDPAAAAVSQSPGGVQVSSPSTPPSVAVSAAPKEETWAPSDSWRREHSGGTVATLIRDGVKAWNDQHPENPIDLADMEGVEVSSVDRDTQQGEPNTLHVSTTEDGHAAIYTQYSLKCKTKEGKTVTINLTQGWDTGEALAPPGTILAEEQKVRCQAMFLQVRLKVKALMQPEKKSDPDSPRHFSDKKMKELNITEFIWNREIVYAFSPETVAGKKVAELNVGSLTKAKHRESIQAIRIGKSIQPRQLIQEFRMKVKCPQLEQREAALSTIETIAGQRAALRSELSKLHIRKKALEENLGKPGVDQNALRTQIEGITGQIAEKEQALRDKDSALDRASGSFDQLRLDSLRDETALAGDRLSELVAILPHRKKDGELSVSQTIDEELQQAEYFTTELARCKQERIALTQKEEKLLADPLLPSISGTIAQKRDANLEWLRAHHAVPQEGDWVRSLPDLVQYIKTKANLSEDEKAELSVRLELLKVLKEIERVDRDIQGVTTKDGQHYPGLNDKIAMAKNKMMQTVDELEEKLEELTTHYTALKGIQQRLSERYETLKASSPNQAKALLNQLQGIEERIQKLERILDEKGYTDGSMKKIIDDFRAKIDAAYETEKLKVVKESSASSSATAPDPATTGTVVQLPPDPASASSPTPGS